MSTVTGSAAHAGGSARGAWPARPARAARAALGLSAVTAGVLGAVGASVMTLVHQAHAASSTIETAARTAALDDGTLPDGTAFDWQDLPPDGDGLYLPDGGEPAAQAIRSATGAVPGADPRGTRVLAMLGDSTAVGYGCRTARDVPGAVLARGAAAQLRRPVRVRTLGVVGAVTADLDGQIATVLNGTTSGMRIPDAVAIMIGANDVRELNSPRRCAARLAVMVRLLREHGVAVVVGTCPDLGVIVPIHQPLRRFAGAWSRSLARAQGRAVTRAGGVPVALARLVSPEFYGHPDLFYADGFHPSGLGYAKASAALLPAVIEALR